MFCILDIESTGGPYGKESIMEIALFRFDGNEIVDQLISLVHPHREIQKYVSKITGITPKMLIRAPRFHELAKRILQLTEGAVLVGHNVEFDYRMLRQEFGRLGYPFEMKTLDTIPLAEKLIPGLQSYGLNTVCDELGIYRVQKHRAEGDARATLDLFRILIEKDKEKGINVLGQSVREKDPVKDKIDDLRRSVKDIKGIYYFHNKAGDLLYLGVSENIKKTLNQIFMADNALAEKLKEEVHTVRTEATGNWLVARIKRVEETGGAKPRYNKEIKLTLQHHIFADIHSGGISLTVKGAGESDPEEAVAKAENRKEAFRSLRMFRRSFKGEEQLSVLKEVSELPEEAIYTGKGRTHKEQCAFVIEQGKLSGYFFYSLNDQISHKDRLKKSFTEIDLKEEFTELLKLGILTGEFRRYGE